MTPPQDSQVARHTGGWIVLGGVFILACLYFKLPQAAGPLLAPGDNIRLGIDVNRATAAELSCIPGVGDGLARRIVEYRETNGPFHSLGQLEQVAGIGPAKAAQLAEALLPLDEKPTRIAASPLPPITTPTGNLND